MAYKKSNPNGQATMANSEPVVIASDQSAVPVTVSGGATSAKQDTIIGHVDGIETAIASTNTKIDTTNASLSVLDDWDNGASDGASVSGDVAHDAVDAGEPVKVGGKAFTGTPTPVANADRTDAWFDEWGRQMVSQKDPELGLTPGLTGLRDQMFVQRYSVLTDSLADGIDSFWTPTVANGGTTTSAGGEGTIATSANATGSAQLTSVLSKYLPGQVGWFNNSARFSDTGSAGNTRRIGIFTVSGTTPQDGFYYELSGTTLNAVTCKAGVATAVASTSWSRFAVAPFTLDTNSHFFEIRYTGNTAWFVIDNVLRHSVSGTSSPITATLNFPMTIQSINASGASDRSISVRNIGMGRFGTPENVTPQDILVTGAGSQLTLNNNIILATAGTSSVDTISAGNGPFHSFSISITPAAGTVTAGAVTFEGSNDNTNFVPIFVVDEANVTATPVSSYSPAASTTRYFKGPVAWKFIRARISTGVTGTTTGLQAFTRFSASTFADERITVTQPTAANLNATITGVLTTVTPGTAATNLGKARDSAIGATDTGVAILGVRRDAPTAETPAAGDYVVPQYSANGEAWVRTAGELADDAPFTVATTRVQPVGYLADSTSTDSVDEGDIGAARMTLDRRQIVQPYEDSANFVSGAITSAMTGTTSTSLVAAPGAGLRNYITTIIVSNAHATVGTDIVIQDGSGGTTLITIPAAAVYGGAVVTLPTPLRQPTANTALFCANVTTGASTKISAVGYKAA